MCSEYTIKAKFSEIESALGSSLRNVSKSDHWDSRIKMTLPAPVIGIKEDQLGLNELIFPVNPFPNARLSQIESNKSDEKIKDAEDGIVRIYDVPIWKTGFERFPCVVPLTSFFEPAYWGENKGKVVEFSDPKSELLFVPGILVKPRVPPTGKFNAFVMLTHTASKQMMENHHRFVVLFKGKDALSYLKLGGISPEERFNFILKHRYVPKLLTSIDRQMAKVWERRVGDHEGKLKSEMKYLAKLENEGVAG